MRHLEVVEIVKLVEGNVKVLFKITILIKVKTNIMEVFFLLGL